MNREQSRKYLESIGVGKAESTSSEKAQALANEINSIVEQLTRLRLEGPKSSDALEAAKAIIKSGEQHAVKNKERLQGETNLK